jgi:prepilin-type N-terminal cleavage/methylation domain-containing protein
MKTPDHNLRRLAGFTLIELLVVIAIIAILAALLIPVGGGIMRSAAKKKTQVELDRVAAAIDDYKAKLGYYPPDNTNDVAVSQLYYELVGCVRTNVGATTYFQPLGGSPRIPATLLTLFSAQGIMNSSASMGADDGAVVQGFLKDIKPGQFGERTFGAEKARVLGVQMSGTWSWPPTPNAATDIIIVPFRYNSSNPTNNHNTYDLWVDIVLGGKTNRISNWSSKPQVL